MCKKTGEFTITLFLKVLFDKIILHDRRFDTYNLYDFVILKKKTILNECVYFRMDMTIENQLMALLSFGGHTLL